MTDEEIRKAACEAFDGASPTEGSLIKSIMFTEVALRSMDAVFRAGMEAGRAESPKRTRAAKAPALDRPSDVAEQTWADWLQLRKDKKATVTPTVLRGAMREADKAGMTLEAFLSVWCYRGSQGLEADWLKPHERQCAQGESVRARESRERVERVAPGAARKVHPLVADADRIWNAVTGGADDARPKRIG